MLPVVALHEKIPMQLFAYTDNPEIVKENALLLMVVWESGSELPVVPIFIMEKFTNDNDFPKRIGISMIMIFTRHIHISEDKSGLNGYSV